jgi:hypothetical protein
MSHFEGEELLWIAICVIAVLCAAIALVMLWWETV